jgi:hypothetical protein
MQFDLDGNRNILLAIIVSSVILAKAKLAIIGGRMATPKKRDLFPQTFLVLEKYEFLWYSWYHNLPLFQKWPLFWRSAAFALVASVIVYLICLAIAWLGGFAPVYVDPASSSPVYIGVLGIGYYIFALFWVVQSYGIKLMELQPFLQTSKSEFDRILDNFFSSISNRKRNLIASALSLLFFLPIANYLFTYPDLDGLINAYPILRFIKIFPNAEWYAQPLWPKLLIFNLIGVIVATDIAISVRVIIHHGLLMRVLGGIDLLSPYLLRVAITKFREVGLFSFWVALNYSVGVWLFIYVGFPVLTAFSVLVITSLTTATYN